jgi:hypothetical protein
MANTIRDTYMHNVKIGDSNTVRYIYCFMLLNKIIAVVT